MARHGGSIDTITSALLATLTDEEAKLLGTDEVQDVLVERFGPLGLRQLPARVLASDECSTDGYYEAIVDPVMPWIIFADDVAPARTHFTLLHELGHHLFATRATHLLDELDQASRVDESSQVLEERICHEFAGRLLVPDAIMSQVVGDALLLPKHLHEIRERCSASWEAIAVRAAEAIRGPGAVVLIREEGVVGFAASSRALHWWPRGSQLDPRGPLARALRVDGYAKQERYRFGMAFEEAMFCDTVRARQGIAVAVLSKRPSDGGVSILEESEPSWKTATVDCVCGGERVEGWCDTCSGRYCQTCGRCGCSRGVDHKTCPMCFLKKPFHEGVEVCVDCEGS